MKKIDQNVKILHISLAIITLAAIVFFGAAAYVMDYYKADQTALTAAENAVDCGNGDYFFDGDPEDNNDTGVIFYPGGKVETEAYAPLCQKIADLGYDVCLVSMPERLAVLNPDKADDIIECRPDIKHWIIMGHSLGGAMAAVYAANHPDEISDLVLLGAYSIRDLSQTDIKVLCMYGSEDGILNQAKFQKNIKNLPEDFTEYVIEGGNHGNFGNYGAQKNDGQALITNEEQQEIVIDQMIKLLELE